MRNQGVSNIKIPVRGIQEKGAYILVIKLKRSQRITVGQLPETNFRPGIYLYVGRARRGLEGRLKRHMRKEKKLFWHIDYLLQKAKIDEIWIKRDSFDECRTVWDIKEILEDLTFPLKKFGSSDCNCPSHLLYGLQKKASLKSWRKRLSLERIDIHGIQV